MFQVDANNGERKGEGYDKAKAKSTPKPNSFDTLKSVGGINKERKVVCFYCGKPGH